MTTNGRLSGTIVTIRRDKAYGFIKVEGQKDVFFHATALQNCTIDDLQEGQLVSFCLGENRQGKPQAEELRLHKD